MTHAMAEQLQHRFDSYQSNVQRFAALVEVLHAEREVYRCGLLDHVPEHLRRRRRLLQDLIEVEGVLVRHG